MAKVSATRLALAILTLGVFIAAAVWVATYRQAHTDANCVFAPSACNPYYTHPGWANAGVGVLIGFAGLAAAGFILRWRT